MRTIYSIDLKEKEGEIVITYTGNGFLHHMIRILTGTLLEVGMKREVFPPWQNCWKSETAKRQDLRHRQRDLPLRRSYILLYKKKAKHYNKTGFPAGYRKINSLEERKTI